MRPVSNSISSTSSIKYQTSRLLDEKANIYTKLPQHYGLGPIIEIKKNHEPKGTLCSKFCKIPPNLWGTLILSILVILSPLFIYLFFSGTNNFNIDLNGYAGFGSDRPRWGVVGLGRVAHDFTVVLKMTGANISAVAAGSLPNATLRAADFAAEFDIISYYGSYTDLANDPTVDIVYISTTSNLHFNVSKIMLNAGKHVLVEMPTCLNAKEVKELFKIAENNGVLLSTNYWTRYFPAFRYARKHIEAESVGKILAVTGDFAFRIIPYNSKDRFLDAHLGGGAMYTLGNQLIQYATLLQHNDMPNRIIAQGLFNNLGVDTEVSFSLQWLNDTSKNENSKRKKNNNNKDDDDNNNNYNSNSNSNSNNSDINFPIQTNNNFSNFYYNDDNNNNSSSTLNIDLNNNSTNTTNNNSVHKFNYKNDFYSLRRPKISSSSANQILPHDVTATFSASLRRESLFTIEFLGEYGTITLVEPANCPTTVHVTLSRRSLYGAQAFGHIFEEDFTIPIPKWPNIYGPQRYLGSSGFTYTIQAIESCLKRSSSCLELTELTTREQILIAEILDDVRQQIKMNN